MKFNTEEEWFLCIVGCVGNDVVVELTDFQGRW